MKTVETDLLIVGAGPAGMFAALQCDTLRVVVLEKNASAGRKLLISGSGRCNITHEGNIAGFISHYGDHARFLKKALYAFTNDDLLGFLHENGVNTVNDGKGKIFPASQNASDVLQALLSGGMKAGVKFVFNSQVINVSKRGDSFEVSTENCVYSSKYMLIATGGMSYPATGSTGDGYHFAKAFGHSIVPPKPALSPVFIRDYAFASLAGVSVDATEVSIFRGGRKVASHEGDIGFTHKGLSGPGILDFSRHMQAGDILQINFIKCTPDELRTRLIEAASSEGGSLILTYLRKSGLSRNLVLVLLKNADVQSDAKIATLTKLQRTAVINTFCACKFEVSKVGGFSMAMVTAGGVNLAEINPETMESKLVNGLYFAGEVLDVDGDTGGYNLQAAFSTAFAAAKHITAQVAHSS